MKLVGERKALAATVFAFWTLIYALLALSAQVPELSPMLAGIAGCYGLAFFAVVAGYFWARWYAVGVGLYGVITAAVGMWQIGPEPIVLFIGGTHLAATLLLWGNSMSGPFDGRLEWRERWHLDDSAVQRLGRSVIRAGVSLPFVLAYALAPKEDAASTVLALGTFALAGFGLRAVVKLRTWGILAMGAAGAVLLATAAVELASGSSMLFALRPALSGALLVAAAAPFVPAILRYASPRWQ